jgi:hypothetical protein
MAFADFEALLRLRVWCLASPSPAIGDPLLPGLRSSSRSLLDSRSSISHCLAGIPAVPEGTAATRQLRFAPGGTAEAVYRASSDRRSVRSMKTALEEPVSGTA